MNRLSTFAASTALIFVLACGAKEDTPAEPVVETVSEGQRLIEEGAFEEAQAWYEGEIASDPAEAEHHFMAGQAAALGARYDAAVAHITKAMELAPDTAAHYDWMGRIYGAQARIGSLITRLQLADSIRQNFEKAAELDPDNPDVQFFLGTYYVLAPESKGGDRSKGEAIAEKLMASAPVSAHRLKAQIQLSKRDTAGAEAEYKEVIALAGDDPVSYTDLAALYLSDNRVDLARENFGKALELEPGNQVALAGLGQLGLRSLDDVDAGIAALEKLAELERNIQSPNMADAFYTIGLLYQKKGQTAEALSAYESALAEGHPTATKAIEAIKQAEAEAAAGAAESADEASTDTQASMPAEGTAAPEGEMSPEDASMETSEPAADATGEAPAE